MNPEFEVNRLSETGLSLASDIINVFDAALNSLKMIVPESRELSIVKTKLEEACFFAKKGMAKNNLAGG